MEKLLHILNKPEDLTIDDILEYNRVKTIDNIDGSFKTVENEFNYSSSIKLIAGDVINLDETIVTTIGRAIFNRVAKTGPFGKFYKYDNSVLMINNFTNQMTVDLMAGRVTADQAIKFFNDVIWMSRFSDICIPSLSQNMLIMPKSSRKLRDKLVEDNKEMIDNGDISYVKDVENVVMADIVENLKDDPSFLLYKLGKPAIGNHLKQTIGTFSPLPDPMTGKYIMPKGNLLDGLSPEDYSSWANVLITGAYGKAVQTQEGGSIVKTMYNSLNVIVSGEKDSDCGTTMYKKVLLDNSNKKLYMWNYIVDNGELVVLSPSNYKKYANTKCEFRTPLYCKSPRFTVCNKCCGELPYKLGMKSIGSMVAKVGFVFVLLCLKGSHDSTVSVVELNPFDYMKIK